MIGFSHRSIEEIYVKRNIEKHASSEASVSKFLAIVEWFFWGMVVKTRGFMHKGTLLQLGLMVLPNTLFAYECALSGEEMNGKRRRIMRLIAKVAYLPICLLIAPYRNPEPTQHPFHLLEHENQYYRVFASCICMPMGAFLAPGIICYVLVVFFMPMKFTNHVKCIVINTALCIVLHTGFTADLLMKLPSSRGWILDVVNVLDKFANFSLATLSSGRLNLDFPILFPCQLWWTFVAVYFQGFLVWSVLWFRDLKTRESFLTEELASGESLIDEEDIITERLVSLKEFHDALTGPWVWFLFLAFQLICGAIIWKVSAWFIWTLSSNGFNSLFENHENWDFLGHEWKTNGVLKS